MQPTRRSYSKSFKAQVIQECVQPGASIVSIVLCHTRARAASLTSAIDDVQADAGLHPGCTRYATWCEK